MQKFVLGVFGLRLRVSPAGNAPSLTPRVVLGMTLSPPQEWLSVFDIGCFLKGAVEAKSASLCVSLCFVVSSCVTQSVSGMQVHFVALSYYGFH